LAILSRNRTRTPTLTETVDNQLAQPKDINLRPLLVVVVAIALLVVASLVGGYLYKLSDPYIQDVLALQGDSATGHAIFEINCAGCHGVDADGHVGPSLQHVSKHKSKISLIQQVVSGNTPPMPKFQPSPQEMADLLSYLETL
jgi:mono/diheme cytochrome c family protein